MLVYSRDACLAAMHHLASMISDIRSRAFDPDALRGIILGGRASESAFASDSLLEPPGVDQPRPVDEQLPVDAEQPPEDDAVHDQDDASSTTTHSSSPDDDLVQPDGLNDSASVSRLGDFILNPRSSWMHVVASLSVAS
eukprot:1533620-Amphidinium_carterae.2